MGTSPQKLAVYSLNIGLPSETFINRHIAELAPGNTVVIAEQVHQEDKACWSVTCPLLRARRVSIGGKRIPEWVRRSILARLLTYKERLAIEKFLRTHGVSTILGEYLHDSWKLLRIAKHMGINLYAHAHGYDLSRIFRDKLWRDRFCDYADSGGVIVVNKIMRNRLLTLGIPGEKIHVIPYGVDVPDAPVKRNRKRIIDLLAVGRMVGKKAPLSLLRAFQIAQKTDANLRLHYVGGGPLYQAASEFVTQERLQNEVRLYGAQPHRMVLDLMTSCDIFVQHSITDPETGDEEGVPVAILEAMAHALPVVSTRHAGIPEAVYEGQTGLLVDEGDIELMASSIVELSQSADLRRDFGHSAWRRAQLRFSSEIERRLLREVLGISSEQS